MSYNADLLYQAETESRAIEAYLLVQKGKFTNLKAACAAAGIDLRTYRRYMATREVRAALAEEVRSTLGLSVSIIADRFHEGVEQMMDDIQNTTDPKTRVALLAKALDIMKEFSALQAALEKPRPVPHPAAPTSEEPQEEEPEAQPPADTDGWNPGFLKVSGTLQVQGPPVVDVTPKSA